MTRNVPPVRSALYVPGHRPDFMAKIGRFGPDAVILDLEDSVPPDHRPAARREMTKWMMSKDRAPVTVFSRINGIDTGCLDDDLAAIVNPSLTAILLPKVSTAQDVLQLDEALTRHEARAGLSAGSVCIWPLLETAKSVYFTYDIATCSPRIAYLGAGAPPKGDIARAIGFGDSGTYMEVIYLLSKVLLDVRAAGVPNPLSFMPTAIGDYALYDRHAKFIRNIGYDGVAMIHPSQVETANRVFGVPDAELKAAERLIREMRAAQKEGKGAIVIDGEMYDEAHLKTALVTVERAKAFENK